MVGAEQPRAIRKQSCATVIAAIATFVTMLASILFIFALADNSWATQSETLRDFPSELPVYDAPTHTLRVTFGIFELCSICTDGVCPGYVANNKPECVRTIARTCTCPDDEVECVGCGAWYSFTKREWAGLIAVRVLLIAATVLLLGALLVGIASVSRNELAPHGGCSSTLGFLQITSTCAHAGVLVAALLAIAAQVVWILLVAPDIRIFGVPPDGKGVAYHCVWIGYSLCFIAAVARTAELILWRNRAALIRAGDGGASERSADDDAAFGENGRAAPLLPSNSTP